MSDTTVIDRVKNVARAALTQPLSITRELNNRSLYHFLEWAWPVLVSQPFQANWHLKYLCDELEEIGYQVGNGLPKDHDLLINISPGTTKTLLVSIIFPVWCWTKWYWMRFITVSYSATLALESAEHSRDLVRSDQFRELYPELSIKEDKDTKSNFKIVRTTDVQELGGNRYSTSVGGTLTGFHADIIIWDDPVNPTQAISEVQLATANHFLDRTLPTRKTDKRKSAMIGIMQRLAEEDPTGHLLAKKKKNLRHISLPGEIRNYRDQLKPKEKEIYYIDDLFDVNRMNWEVLKELEADLGQYAYAGQIGQNPVPAGGGMFKVDHLQYIQSVINDVNFVETVRYWDKAGTEEGGAYTTGVKIAKLLNNKCVVMDVKRGQWASEERERIIKQTAEADGRKVIIMVEQEPGSGGKESAENTIRNLAGFHCERDLPKGNKVFRADPLSVQVNNGNIILLNADWNYLFVEEFRHFPFGKYKDQVDATAAGFNHLMGKRAVKRIT